MAGINDNGLGTLGNIIRIESNSEAAEVKIEEIEYLTIEIRT